MKLIGKSVVIVVPYGLFNDVEYQTVLTTLEREGCRVKLAGASLQPAIGMNGMNLRPQHLFSEVETSKFDGIIFIGGIGARDFWKHPGAHAIARKFHTQGKLLAAICLAPVTFAQAGMLRGKKATCHPAAMHDLEQCGVTSVVRPVVVCGNIVTADGPQSAVQFSEAIVHMFSNRNVHEI